MRLRRLAIAVVLTLLPASGPLRAEPMAARLERALEHPALRGARLAVLVVRADDGAALFARSPDRALVPASNLKILTALAALESLGPTHRFTTGIYADAEPDAAGQVGYLAVRGGGDPTLTSEQWWRLAADLRRAGLRRVRSGLVLDDSLLDRERWNPAWGAVSTRAYHAPVGALSANYGAFAVAVRPGEQTGDPVRAAVDPPLPYLQLVIRARTGAPGTRTALAIDRVAGSEGEQVIVTGSIAAGGEPRVFYRSVADPARYAGAVLRMQLEANGIRVEGPTLLGPIPEGASELLAFEGKPLGEIVRLFVKHSNNAIAETLVKDLGNLATGAAGSWVNGLAAVRASLGRAGVDTRGLVIVDGSGLAHRNRVSPRTLVNSLRVAQRSFRFGPELLAALPIAAGDGTLRERAKGAAGAVRAKTGLLDRVTALSGFARTPDAGEVLFSVLANGYRRDDEAAMAALDGFVAALVGGGEGVAQERLSRASGVAP